MIRLLTLSALFFGMNACRVAPPFLDGERLHQDSFVSQNLIQGGDIPRVLAELEYQPGEPARVLTYDLNRDGIQDYLIRSSTQLCGSGGCPYVIVDGRSYRRIGEVFGAGLVLSDSRVAGWPAVQTFSSLSSDSGSYSMHFFDGREYFEGVRIHLQGAELESVLANFKATGDLGR